MLSIIIVTFNSSATIERCLKSLYRASGDFPQEIIVVDNASKDNTKDIIRRHFPSVKLIESHENSGFSTANNMGYKISSGRFILFLNPDAEIIGDALSDLAGTLEKDKYTGAVVPALHTAIISNLPDGYCYKFPSLWVDFLRSLHLDRWVEMYKLDKQKLAYEEPMEVGRPSGSCLMVHREAFENIGHWDEDYGLYFEDVDLFWKLRVTGWKVKLIPAANVLHIGGGSSGKILDMRNILVMAGKFTFYRKNRNLFSYVALYLIWWRKLVKYFVKYNILPLDSRKSFVKLTSNLFQE